MTPVRHIGLSLGRLSHWHDGLGEFSRQLGRALVAQAPRLRMRPGPRVEAHCELIRTRLVEQFDERSDTFPLPPDELKTLLLL